MKKTDDLIHEHILKPIQTAPRVWIVGGITLALILIVALWPSKTEVVKAVVKHEIVTSETYQSNERLAKAKIEEARALIEEARAKIKEVQRKKAELVRGRITGQIDDSSIADDIRVAGAVKYPDEQLAFLNSIMSEDERADLDKYESKTKEASAKQYAHLHEMVTPYSNRPLNEVEQFYQNGIDHVMNDTDTPGLITEWEARWITVLWQTKRGYDAKQKMQERKDSLTKRFLNK